MRRNENGFLNTLLSVLMIFLVVGLALLVFFNYQANTQQMEEIAAAEAAAAATPTPVPTATPEPTPVPERNVETVTLAFTGDIVGQAGITTDAQQTAEDGSVSYDYSLQLAGVADILSDANLSSGTLVGTLAAEGEFGAYRLSSALANAMAGAGFQVVNAATDHILDNGVDGLVETVSILNGEGLQTVGAYTSELSHGLFLANVGDLKVAFLSYTYGTGGTSVASNSWCVDILTTDYMSDRKTVDYDRIDSDIAAVKQAGADLVVCYVYWWDNDQYYYDAPRDNQVEVANYLTENGVDVVIGSGVKVPQPIEVETLERADGTKANTVVCYSLSNLLSAFGDQYTNISAVAKIQVSRDLDTGEVWVSGVSYEPMFTLDTEDNGEYGDGEDRFWALDAYAAVEDYENGADRRVTEETYEAIRTGIADLQSILGAEYDSVNGGVFLEYPY